MEISETALPGLYLAVVQGRLDGSTAAKAEEALLPLLGTARVVLDLAAVSFVSSAGLRVLLKAAKLAKSSGTAFVICGMQPTVREVYEISGFDRIIEAHPGRAEALARFA
ncbi:STAS domain-containing protein [Acidisoma sp. C75]